MTDIVDLLRCAHSVDGSAIMLELSEDVVQGAINEITKLRAELAAIRQVAGAVSVDYFNYADFKRELRSAPKPDPNGEVS